MSEFNKMQTLKRRFFAMRNGVIADRLRRAGSQFRIIFGLNLPQLNEIAADYGHDPEFAALLWNNITTRESMLLAPMLMTTDDIPADSIEIFCSRIADVELADVVCHKLLKRMDDPVAIALRFADSSSDIFRYISLRLLYGMVDKEWKLAAAIAQNEISRNCHLTLSTARMLLSEANFVASDHV